MRRIEQRELLVIDEGDFYEVENSRGIHYIPFEGESGQSNPSRVLLDHFGIGEVELEDTEPFQYESVFETLEGAQKELLQLLESQQESEEDEDLCSRCDIRPASKNGLCASCIKVVQSLKGVV